MHTYRVSDSQLLTDSVRLLTLTCEEGSHPMPHEPGQYAAISLRDRLRPTVMRCFSITSSPTDQRTLQFSLRIGGRYTRAVSRLKVGDEVAVRGPYGGFVFDPSHTNQVLLAGGIGVSPFMSMIRFATARKLRTKIHLVYSCRTQDDIPFYEDLADLAKKNRNLRITYVISQGPVGRLRGQEVLQGRLDETVLPRLGLDYQGQAFMVCGLPSYMKNARRLLRRQRVPSRQIFTESFTQGSARQTGKLRSWPFNMYALGGVTFLIAVTVITALDLYHTIPKLNAKQGTSTATKNVITTQGGNHSSAVNAVGPKVSTNLDQPAQSTGGASTASQGTSQTASQAAPVTVTNPQTPPKTKVS